MIFSNRAITAGSSLFVQARGRVQSGIQKTKLWASKIGGEDEDPELLAMMERMHKDKKYRGDVRRNFHGADFNSDM